MLSPTLFSFLINELALEIAQNGMYGVQLTPHVVQILVMLFADDVLFASYCVAGLQRQTDILKHFADIFSMTANMSKTKIIVFRKGGFLAVNEVWRYGDEEIEVVNSYKYLGLYFTTKLSLTQAVADLAVRQRLEPARYSNVCGDSEMYREYFFFKCMMLRSYRFLCMDLSCRVSNSLQ